MDFVEFERRAAAVWEEIPEAYRAGVDGLVLEKEPRPHPTLEDIYTLGECLTETWPSEWGGPDTTRSVLVLYHGSFRRLSELDPDFDWGYEIWETITHELRHHLESLATEDALEDVDYAMDENFKRLQGEPFDPFFYRSGEPLGPGVWRAERDVFIEVALTAADAPGSELEFRWRGVAYLAGLPDDRGDVTFLQVVEGIPDDPTDPAELCLVLVRKPGRWTALRRWLRRDPLDIIDVDVAAREKPGA